MSITVTGGTVTYDGSYTVRTFTASDTLTISGGTLTGVDYLLIARGGAGATFGTYRGGGGAGGVIQISSAALPPGSYPVTFDAKSGNAVFNGHTAVRGGNGTTLISNGVSGGSGGGSAVYGGWTHNPIVAGNGIPGQGHRGGSSPQGGFPPRSAGGGGGAGGEGGAGGRDYGQPGTGGVGIQSSITGTATWYAGGGGAWTGGAFGMDGLGCANYGGGGGYGTGQYVPPKPGVLIIRYLSV